MTKKNVKALFIGVMVLLILSWLAFQLITGDIRGEIIIIKRLYYQTVRLLQPIKPAISLAIPYHQQEHSLSCEIAALLMALRYKGVDVTETELIRQLPIADAGPRHKDNTWGDPNVGFVGNIDGTMPNTGYGVYEKPIHEVASKYRTAKIIENGTVADLITALTNDNPVVVWGVVDGRTRDISWKTPEGKTVDAQLDEHARTLIGFTGTSKEPKLLILLDPIYGEIRLTVKDFLKNWQLLNNRAVIIY